jgi:hypothetical protein
LKASIDVLVVGPQRTASSWLDRALRSHVRLCFPTYVKETFFFDRHYHRGQEWYFSHFGEHTDGVLLAEVGPTYFESTEARQRIRAMNPKARIVILVRNPIIRAFSSFGHEYAKGRCSADFFEAVSTFPRIIDAGRYGKLAPEWERAFGIERIFYLVQEEIEADAQRCIDDLCNFLGIESVELSDESKGRYGKGSVPRFRWLAAMAARSATLLRGAGLHRVVEAGKRVGLKRVYTGGHPEALSITRPIFDHLLSEHEADIRFLEERLSRSFRHWRDPARAVVSMSAP